MPSVKDGRARFREIFCKLLSEAPKYRDKPEHCENYLTRLSDERMPAEQLRPLPVSNINLRILIVPGLLGECIADTAFPFEKTMGRLRPLGYQIGPLIVSGRSSSDYNAKQIAKAVANPAVEEKDFLILIGHSKGVNDILHFLVNYPGLAHRIDAVVSVAGAINGSPIANQVADIYSKLGANLPFNKCEPGDGGAFRSLKRPVRLTWLANNPLPTSVKYYSVVSFTGRDRINRWLTNGYDILKTIDPRNDGLLLFSDQVIPGAVLLGYVNDEKQGDKLSQPLPMHDANLRIILVTGAFAECFPKMGKPYEDAAVRLEKLGYRIDTIVVGGRSSSSHNAAMIAKTVNAWEPGTNERLILLGY